MINKGLTFYPNTPDDTHCFQAALKMVLKYFYPREDYSFEDLDKITAKVEGLWTWPTAGILWLKNKGMKVKVIEIFDFKKFVKKGGQYIIDEFGATVGQEQIDHSDIAQEQVLAMNYIKKVSIEKRIPTISELRTLLENGYLPICNVNSEKLNRKEGYTGHFVIVKGYDEHGFVIHDPGLPPLKNRKVTNNEFDQAWAYPDEKAKNIIAIKK
jgi:hypothetical protein